MTATVEVSMAPTVLVVDDEPDIRDLARALLELDGFHVVDDAEDGVQALERFLALDPPPIPTVVVLDNRMPGFTGLQVAEQMLQHNPTQVIVLFSAHLDPTVEQEARALGVAGCVSKRDTTLLPDIIRRLLPAA